MEAEKQKYNSVDKPKVNGGARPGAGRPKGGMNESTKIRMAAKQEFQRRVVAMSDQLFNAQYDLAIGEKFLLVKRVEGEGKNRKTWIETVTSLETIKEYIEDDGESLNDGEDFYYLSTKPANNMALDSLLNRAYGKPDEKLTLDGEVGPPVRKFSESELDERIRQYLRRYTAN
jgi:hypothetical protein